MEGWGADWRDGGGEEVRGLERVGGLGIGRWGDEEASKWSWRHLEKVCVRGYCKRV